MKILITTTFNRNMTESRIKPLVMLPEVEHILQERDIDYQGEEAYGKNNNAD